jgi:hypothetical protein
MNPKSPDRPATGEPAPAERKEKRKTELTSDDRKRIVSTLLLSVQDGNPKKLRRGVLSAVAESYHVNPQTIRRVWARALQNYEDPDVRAFRSSPQKNKCGRKKKWNANEVREAIKAIPKHQKMSIRELSAELHIPRSTLHYFKSNQR